MMVSVEPKKVGYGDLHKIKRNVELKDVPLILTSGEEAPEKFEQHKTSSCAPTSTCSSPWIATS